MACLLDNSMVGKKQVTGPGKHKPSHPRALITVVWIYIEETGKNREK